MKGGKYNMQIRKGTKLKYQYENEEDIFTIIGTRQLRNKYYYIFTDSKNIKQSLTVEKVNG